MNSESPLYFFLSFQDLFNTPKKKKEKKTLTTVVLRNEECYQCKMEGNKNKKK